MRQVGIDLLAACGASREEAGIVADELVEASLMGLDSHGVMRYIQYAEDALSGKIKPGAPIRIVKETDTTAIVDAGLAFGPVSATRMVEIACDKAERHNVSCVVSQNGQHVGRLGTYVTKCAQRGFVALATVNSSKHGHWVVPWGGREGRLATNPLAFAAPTAGRPIVLDMSTAMIAEGKIRVLRQAGKPVPEGCILAADGTPTTDPAVFYGPPHGSILPFGSQNGYKGFGLSLMVEILGGLLAGMATSQDHPYINGLCITAINPQAFCGRERFVELTEDLKAYMLNTPPAPGHERVVMPGQLDDEMHERRLRDGIPVAENTWEAIVAVARKVSVTL
jgi:uncharacterized oxidoreductase